MKVMFRRPSKKQKFIQRLIVYAVMVLAILAIVAGTVLFILGYRLSGDRGQLEQVAIIQFDSTPSGAEIIIDGRSVNARTAAKQSVLVGTHSFIVQRDGYETWSKTLTLGARSLTWLDYIRLVPKELALEKVATYTSVAAEKTAPDGRFMLIQEKASQPVYQWIDLRSETIKTSTLTLPASAYSSAANDDIKHTFTLDSWDQGGRYILVKHNYGSKSEWIVMDTQNVSESVNVTRLLGLNVSSLKFASTNGNILYGLADGVVRKLDLSSATISRGLVSNVQSFDVFETNIITYVGTDSDDENIKVAGIYRDGDAQSHVLRRVSSKATPLAIDASRYFSDYYVAIAEGLKVTILKGTYPASSDESAASLGQFAEFMAAADVETLGFSNEGDYLVAQSGLTFASYEIEHQRLTNASIAATGTRAQTLRWLDRAYLWAVHDGQLSIREFDGTNVHVINAAELGFDAALSQNGRFLYSIGKSEDGYQLQRVKMILD